MAFTVSHVANYTSGNQRIKQLIITADSAEANIETGLSIIDSFQLLEGNMGLNSIPTILMNKDSSNTASNGNLGISGVASNAVMYIHVYGR